MDAAEVVATATRLWKMHQKELPQLERIYAYSRGKRGRASVPDDADAELLELAAISVINVMPLVIDAFVPALTVSGFRSPSSEANLAAWDTWQRERMDARQSEVHRPAVTYGASYLLLRKGPKGAEFLPRTPRRMFAAYVDPTRDEWPQYALETWLDESGPKKLRRGYLYDDTTVYPVTLNGSSASSRLTADPDSEPFSHGFTVVPVVRFGNDRDAEDLLHGEVEPLIVDQQAINATNFDRLVVSRYGAFPQKVITGWAANS